MRNSIVLKIATSSYPRLRCEALYNSLLLPKHYLFCKSVFRLAIYFLFRPKSFYLLLLLFVISIFYIETIVKRIELKLYNMRYISILLLLLLPTTPYNSLQLPTKYSLKIPTTPYTTPYTIPYTTPYATPYNSPQLPTTSYCSRKQKWRHLLGDSSGGHSTWKKFEFWVSEIAFPGEIPTYTTHWSSQLKFYSCTFLLRESGASGYFILSNAARP